MNEKILINTYFDVVSKQETECFAIKIFLLLSIVPLEFFPVLFLMRLSLFLCFLINF